MQLFARLFVLCADGATEVLAGCLQDALKKSRKDELPDFYNIQLERPKDDPGGYDCLFIDAASKVR